MESKVKRCNSCLKDKVIADFYQQKRYKSGGKPYGSYYTCKDCMRKTTRAAKLKTKYNISIEEYEQLLEKQGGLCAICGAPPTKLRRLAVDHDHITGTIRGLLCFNCNVGIGAFKESYDLMIKVINYLDKGK